MVMVFSRVNKRKPDGEMCSCIWSTFVPETERVNRGLDSRHGHCVPPRVSYSRLIYVCIQFTFSEPVSIYITVPHGVDTYFQFVPFSHLFPHDKTHTVGPIRRLLDCVFVVLAKVTLTPTTRLTPSWLRTCPPFLHLCRSSVRYFPSTLTPVDVNDGSWIWNCRPFLKRYGPLYQK